MTIAQNQHCFSIEEQFKDLLWNKYIKGAKEHGGLLSDQPTTWILDQAIEEAIDQVVYLLTLKQQFEAHAD